MGDIRICARYLPSSTCIGRYTRNTVMSPQRCLVYASQSLQLPRLHFIQLMSEFDNVVLRPIQLALQTEFQHRLTPLRTIFTAGSPSRALRVIVLP
jgi:hypothetical protein